MSKGRGGREREELPRPRIGRGEQLAIYCRSAQGSPSIKGKCVAMVVETGPDEEEWSVASGCRFSGGEVLPLGSLEHDILEDRR
jgi:hypothetical protein